MSMKEKSISKNAILNIILTLTNIVFPLITFPYISRILNPSGIGAISFFSSIGSYGVLVASLGISTYGIRVIAKNRYHKDKITKIFQELIVINSVMSIIVTFFLVLMSFRLEQLSSEKGLLIITCITILSSPFNLNWFYSGIEEHSYITKRSIFFKLVSLILTFLFVKSKDDYIIYAVIILFSTLASNFINILESRKYINFNLRRNLEFRYHLKPMWYLFASLLAVNIYTNLDSVMLGIINGNDAVGIYSIASKVKWILLSVVTSVSLVLLPRLSFYSNKYDETKFNNILRKSSTIIFMISIPLTIFFMIKAKESILLLGGEQYIQAVLAMQILMPILIISGFSNIIGNQILIPTGNEKYFMRAVSIGAIVNLCLNLLLMPILGIIGGAIATLCAESVQMIIQFYFSRNKLMGNISLNSIKKVAYSSIFAGILLIVIQNIIENFNSFLNLAASSFLYFGVYFFLLVLFKESTIKKFLNQIFYKDIS
ncbi:TPA: flippase [Streptococcus pneumoniae]